ncbi:Glycerol-3-phosphate dehydrogenase SDP6, mitochondrial [Galdieria sulphuraria]|nr:Glycerol-3-phosphate dehydrogenase SDP6, mitochondrial [Galdieria sulphuraria]
MGAFRKTLLFVGGSVLVVGALGAAIIGTSSSAAPFARIDESSNNGKYAVRLPPLESVPPRQKQLESLRSYSQEQNSLDILVIGGGATGSGVALDAALRGLSVGLVERDDFASGTSSRSTKLIHGGVRYLEKAFFN